MDEHVTAPDNRVEQPRGTEFERLLAYRDEERTQSARDLATVIRELEAFAYSVSHDLRAPLRAIDGFSQALLEDYAGQLDEQGQDYLKRIRAAAQRMGTLIDDLLKLSRVTRDTFTPETVDLTRLATEIATDLRAREPDRAVEIRIAPGLTAHGDRNLLRIAFDNLIGNAWKFTRARHPGRIEVRQEEIEGEATFVVEDNGAGFDMRYADKLFGAFQRLHSAAQFEGTGVGLATASRIIRRHGGRIWARSEVDVGTSFYFTLGAAK